MSLTTIYLVRHGIAEEGSPRLKDEDRSLTEDGRRRMQRIGQGLKRLGVVPDAILTSPLKRAVQTAQLLAKALLEEPTQEVFDALAPGHTPGDVVAKLRPQSRTQSLMLVGHEPGISRLASYLLTGSADALGLQFKKGAVVAIEIDRLPPKGPGTLLWFTPPSQLRLLSE